MKFKPSSKPGKIIIELDRNDSFPEETPQPREQRASAFRLKKILVPIDFSDCSKKALSYALPYAKEFGASITLLYVAHFQYVASEINWTDTPALEQQHLERAKQELLKLTRQIPSSIKCETAVIRGKPFQEIVAAAKALEFDLIIIATHGAMGMQHEFLGSTAERVARYADCPVLIVRERQRDFVTSKKNERKTKRQSSVSGDGKKQTANLSKAKGAT